MLERENRRLKKMEQETIKKDQMINSLKQNLAYSNKKRVQYKKQRPTHLHTLKNDPNAECAIWKKLLILTGFNLICLLVPTCP